MKEHDYKDTLNEINNAEDKNQAAKAARRDAEIAYETLAVSSFMGEVGMEEQLAELIQLQLTQEMLYKMDDNKKDD